MLWIITRNGDEVARWSKNDYINNSLSYRLSMCYVSYFAQIAQMAKKIRNRTKTKPKPERDLSGTRESYLSKNFQRSVRPLDDTMICVLAHSQ